LSNQTRNNTEQEITLKSDVTDKDLIALELKILAWLLEFTQKNEGQ
jgi:hypothetical protein